MPLELERAGNLLKKYAREHIRDEIKIQSFSSSLEFLTHAAEKGGFDVLLLDIYMPGDKCEIIFLTTSRDHAVDAFSLDAAHYLVKPYSEKEFFAALDKVMDKLLKKDEATITVKSTDGIRRLGLGEIVYSETDGHVQKINLMDGSVTSIRKSSTELFELLEAEPRFYKCGSTYIINMDYIVELTSKNVVFSTGAKIPMLSRKYTDFKQWYMDYSCGH